VKQYLLNLPRFLEAPRDVVRNCRALTPTAELVYIDEGAWYLGSVEPTAIRLRMGGLKRARAARMWHAIHSGARPDPVRVARARWMWWEGTLLMEGFAGIEVFRGDPDSRVEEFLRRRHYGWANDLDATFRRFLAEEDQEGREDDPKDELVRASSMFEDHKLREAYKYAFTPPVSFTSKLPARKSA
jgi:hypothetical protein